MVKIRPALRLILVFFCVSLICDPSACCAIAGDHSCQAAQQEGSPGGGLSGVGILPGAAESAANAGKGDRLAPGILEALPTRIAGDVFPIAATTTASGPELAAPTPLYLSHCAFLC